MWRRFIVLIVIPVILIGCGGGEQHPQPTTRAEFESQIKRFVQNQNAKAIDALRYQVEGTDTTFARRVH